MAAPLSSAKASGPTEITDRLGPDRSDETTTVRISWAVRDLSPSDATRKEQMTRHSTSEQGEGKGEKLKEESREIPPLDQGRTTTVITLLITSAVAAGSRYGR
jgi:hypothetical protein